MGCARSLDRKWKKLLPFRFSRGKKVLFVIVTVGLYLTYM